jgi:uncharacterized membrane protein YhiD involved in acid resistance
VNEYLTAFFGAQEALTLPQIIGAMILSFLLSMVFAVVYQATFRGFTYSRSYIHTMVIGSMVTCMLIMAVGSNLARGMGILGTLAIIRFRTPVRDPRDAMFLFACLGVGIACGSRMPSVALTGTVLINLAACILHWIPFASRREYEGLLRFSVAEENQEARQQIDDILIKYCDSFYALGVRKSNQDRATEYSYQLRLIDPSYKHDIIKDFSSNERFHDPVLMMQRTTVEL